ncbi:MAG TPA: V-type ATP synthase subunit F [Planctomycetota bacterium]|nr:V-type ATP synthase subunit F [Planctomycetota bacterium]
MARLIVVGTRQLTLPLSAVGFEPVEAAGAVELAVELNRLSVDETVAMVVCGESQAAGCTDAVMHFRRHARGVVLVVPDEPVPRKLGREQVRLAIEQAAGVDLLGRAESK